MSTSKYMDIICIAAIILAFVILLLFIQFGAFDLSADQSLSYEDHLFRTDTVHTVDIQMEDWNSFIASCEDEEYSLCDVVIDGETFTDIALRAKGNTSLSQVKSMESQRYSFKLEFDHYRENGGYYGLDKLCLNNLIQDNTMMKDYLVYTMMNDFGVASPLCSYVYITVNGEDWGLYLAVEGIEEGFLKRKYNSLAGDLYKPDSMRMGGGRGNGKNFDTAEFSESTEAKNDDEKQKQQNNTDVTENEDSPAKDAEPGKEQLNGQLPPGDMPENTGEMPQGQAPPGDMPENTGEMPQGQAPPGDMPENKGEISQNREPPEDIPEGITPPTASEDNKMPKSNAKPAFSEMSMFGNNDDVKLKYIDDNAKSYGNIFDNAKTAVTSGDKKRLLTALKKLSAYSDLESTLDTEEVLRYFVVHNFVCNEDSYTGLMVHNYYLYEEEGRLAMIPWDYNLAFGTFRGSDATGTVNADIDNPVSEGTVDDRPMVGWIFSDEKYTEQYHELFGEFLQEWYHSGKLANLIDTTAAMLEPYVAKDPTKFCTVKEFDAAVSTVVQFAALRSEAVSRQLQGDPEAVAADSLNLSDMGSMGRNGFGIKANSTSRSE